MGTQVDLPGVALVIVALGSFVSAVGGVVVAIMVNMVHREVRTSNDLTIGALQAAEETRRIAEIPHGDRTEQEQRHIETSPPPGPSLAEVAEERSRRGRRV